jgi:hypothetical protein
MTDKKNPTITQDEYSRIRNETVSDIAKYLVDRSQEEFKGFDIITVMAIRLALRDSAKKLLAMRDVIPAAKKPPQQQPLEIKKILILRSKGSTDKIILHTNLPDPCWPYEGNASLEMSAAHGSGVDFARRMFNIEPEVIEC